MTKCQMIIDIETIQFITLLWMVLIEFSFICGSKYIQLLYQTLYCHNVEVVQDVLFHYDSHSVDIW